jgi:hypothetical protein
MEDEFSMRTDCVVAKGVPRHDTSTYVSLRATGVFFRGAAISSMVMNLSRMGQVTESEEIASS